MSSNEDSITNNDEIVVGVFDGPTCSGGSVCDIFDNEYHIITEDYIFWVNTNRSICQGKVIEIPFSDLPQYYNHLKLI